MDTVYMCEKSADDIFMGCRLICGSVERFLGYGDEWSADLSNGSAIFTVPYPS